MIEASELLLDPSELQRTLFLLLAEDGEFSLFPIRDRKFGPQLAYAAEAAALTEVRQSVERLKGEGAAIEGSIDRLASEKKDLAQAITMATAEHRTIEEEIATLRSCAEGQQREIKRLGEEAVEAAAKRERDEAATTELRRQRDALRGEIEMLKKVLASLEGKVGPKSVAEAEETLADLLVVPSALKRASTRITGLRETDALNQVRAHLRDQGLEFSERVVNAFHTSLKISSISPLTVLAGISGTGKSELPRQYATAIGIPFFQLAVQPRWDSPQDLFGFYNYLEHRYKPTELVRVMVHFDTRFWPKQAEPYKDHMALVLLDEMNLARVEYYFSEFLSRLEVRRDKENEPAAEIELELGHLPEGFPKKLYPVARLLFVGTMNEDEFTQTLSDKVVDRANVLRFARPRKLVSPTVDEGAERVSGVDKWLPFSVWKSWLATGLACGRRGGDPQSLRRTVRRRSAAIVRSGGDARRAAECRILSSCSTGPLCPTGRAHSLALTARWSMAVHAST